jgi:type IV secretory pathway VirB10-like protein
MYACINMCIEVAPLAMGSGGFLVALWSDGNQETEIPNMVMEGPPKKEAAKKEPGKKKAPKKEPAKKEPAKKEAPKKKANTKRKLGAECAEGDQEAQKAQNAKEAKEAKKNAPEGAGGRSDQLKDIIATLSSRAGFKVTMVNGTEQSYLLGKLGAKQKLVIPCGRSMARDLFFKHVFQMETQFSKIRFLDIGCRL